MFYNKKKTKTRLTLSIFPLLEKSGSNNQSFVYGQSFVIKLQQNYQFGNRNISMSNIHLEIFVSLLKSHIKMKSTWDKSNFKPKSLNFLFKEDVHQSFDFSYLAMLLSAYFVNNFTYTDNFTYRIFWCDYIVLQVHWNIWRIILFRSHLTLKHGLLYYIYICNKNYHILYLNIRIFDTGVNVQN